MCLNAKLNLKCPHFTRVYQHVFTTKRIRTVAEICLKKSCVVTFSQRCWMFVTDVSTDREAFETSVTIHQIYQSTWLTQIIGMYIQQSRKHSQWNVGSDYTSYQWRQDVCRSSWRYSTSPTVQGTGTTGAFAVHSKNSHLLNWSKSESIVCPPYHVFYTI